MSNPLNQAATSQRHLLLVLAPTPNGRLHLGHHAGPFLRVDVLARHLRRKGDRVRIIGGTDAYESYVTLAAHNQQTSAEAICSHYHPLIQADLNALDICPEPFINPLQAEFNAPYQETYRAMLQRLIDGKRVREINEKILYCPSSSRYIVGCWLLGNCPACGNAAGSYLCEECGQHFRPEELEHAQSRLDEGGLETITAQNLFAEVPDKAELQQLIQTNGTCPAAFRQVSEQYLHRPEARIRLTNPGTWGVSWQPDPYGVPRVIFSYAGLYTYSLFCGQQYAQLEDINSDNAFAHDSGVTTVLTYGIDNAIPMQLGVLGAALADGAYKPVDALLGCYFYNLEGSKFSTSRGHVIWGRDIVDKTPAASDIVRYYLCQTNPESAPSNFDVNAFVELSNQLTEQLQRQFQQASVASEPASPADALLQRLDQALEAQERAMDLQDFNLAAMLTPLQDWLEPGFFCHCQTAGTSYWWLKGLALLAYPVMPRMATALWQALGYEQDYPQIETFQHRPPGPWSKPLDMHWTTLTASQLIPCLPHSIRSQ